MPKIEEMIKKLDKKQRSWIRTALKAIGKTTVYSESLLLKKLLSLGVDLSTRSAVKSVLTLLNADTNTADSLYIKITNEMNMSAFSRTEYSDRALFLPQCLRNIEKCKATMTEEGWQCKNCGSCSIGRIKTEAEKFGCWVYVVPGGSMVMDIIGRKSLKGVVGVACNPELSIAAEKLTNTMIWGQGVSLLKDGCKDTIVDEDEVIIVLGQKQ